MMLSAYPRNLTKFSLINRALKAFINKKRRVNHLQIYLTTKKVRAFRKLVLQALQTQVKQVKGDLVRRAVNSIGKLSQADIDRVRVQIDKDWGSFDNYVSQNDLTQYLTGVYNDGVNAQMQNLGIEGTFNLSNPDVVARLQDRSTYLIDSVDNTTKDDLASMISEGVDEGLSWEEIADDIYNTYSEEISPYRAELIARMETANAYNQSHHDFMIENGITKHIWTVDGNPCDDCQENADEGELPIDATFATGDLAPPAHPNCQCEEQTIEELPVDYEPEWTGE